jgi:pimeloyl-ACP methyl ester carboxylesterase
MQAVESQDGTKIAFDKLGKGPAVILVNGALSSRGDSLPLAELLSEQFTVYSFDRRGRGDSSDVKPYAVKREIEDIRALAENAGGSVCLYGQSSGACLALRAAASLGDIVKKLAIYEAPYSDDAGAAPEWKSFTKKLDGLLAADRNEDAVTAFMKFVGMPDRALAQLKESPAWAKMVKLGPTIAYDNALLGDDRSVPERLASEVRVPTVVMTGEKSMETMPFMKTTADKLANVMAKAERKVVKGQEHVISPDVLAPILASFFKS